MCGGRCRQVRAPRGIRLEGASADGPDEGPRTVFIFGAEGPDEGPRNMSMFFMVVSADGPDEGPWYFLWW